MEHFQVLLYFKILTSAHCVIDKKVSVRLLDYHSSQKDYSEISRTPNMIRIHQKFNLRSYANDIALIRIPVSFFRFLFLGDFQPCVKQELSFRVVQKPFNQPVFPRGLSNFKNRDQFVSFPVGEAIFPGKTGCETVGWSRQEWKLLVKKDVPKSSVRNLTRRNNFASFRWNYRRKQVGKFFNNNHLLRLFYQYWNYSLTRELRAWIKFSQYR